MTRRATTSSTWKREEGSAGNSLPRRDATIPSAATDRCRVRVDDAIMIVRHFSV